MLVGMDTGGHEKFRSCAACISVCSDISIYDVHWMALLLMRAVKHLFNWRMCKLLLTCALSAVIAVS